MVNTKFNVDCVFKQTYTVTIFLVFYLLVVCVNCYCYT